MPHDSNVETAERVIPAPPQPIFALLADPRRHHEFDGSGSVRTAKMRVEKLSLGSRFGMSMRYGLPYSMVNTVVEYQENRLIAWQTRAPGFVGKFIGGRIWRYELSPVEGGTLVRESWDISQETGPSRRTVQRMAKLTRKNMAATLKRLESAVAG